MSEYSSLQYKPLQFATTEYKPTIGQLQQADMNLLANSMEKKENRIREADRQKAIVNSALGQYREQINTDDPDTLRRFNEISDKVNRDITQLAAVGNYGDAIRMATNIGGNLANNNELQGMVKTNKQYQDWQNSIKSRNDISQLTKEYALSTNKYKFQTSKDADGNIIRVNDWTPTNNVYEDLNIDDINRSILAAANPDSNTNGSSKSNASSSSRSVPNAGVGTISTESSTKTSNSSTHSENKLTTEKIKKAADDYYIKHINQVGQMVKVFSWKKAQLQKQLVDITDDSERANIQQQIDNFNTLLTDKNGLPLTQKDVFNRLVSNMEVSAAYKQITNQTSSDYETSSGYGDTSGEGTNRGVANGINALNGGIPITTNSGWHPTGSISYRIGQSYNNGNNVNLGIFVGRTKLGL